MINNNHIIIDQQEDPSDHHLIDNNTTTINNDNNDNNDNNTTTTTTTSTTTTTTNTNESINGLKVKSNSLIGSKFKDDEEQLDVMEIMLLNTFNNENENNLIKYLNNNHLNLLNNSIELAINYQLPLLYYDEDEDDVYFIAVHCGAGYHSINNNNLYRNLMKQSIQQTINQYFNNLNNLNNSVSSGGISLKYSGRIGEASIYGSGCYSDTKYVQDSDNDNFIQIASNFSGIGEDIMLNQMSNYLVDKIFEIPMEQALFSIYGNLINFTNERKIGCLSCKVTDYDQLEFGYTFSTESMGIAFDYSNNLKNDNFNSIFRNQSNNGIELNVKYINLNK
ncbi:predicted protein [Naegleria gruberi]|uniref:Predicted protein n=1 Tax=Naegleria gruberi TaxID=5762 RepID=D2V5S6_NAEGR|nr:uncharacterized protein NAEGRDRAFT_64187 [Naegleria gruberi]EFC47846.1 predicted protein [Naegleria gruberi]|eukprot:XP_002680590.1 predicted protein [Naegleria gruberi strain NEG-M]